MMHISKVYYEGNVVGASPREAKRWAKAKLKPGEHKIIVIDLSGRKHEAKMEITDNGNPRTGQGKMNGKRRPQNKKSKNKRSNASRNKNRARLRGLGNMR